MAAPASNWQGHNVMSKLSPGTLLLGIMAVLFGLLGAYVVRLQMRPTAVAAQQEVQTVVVPRASTDLKAGRKLTLSDIAVYRMTPQEMQQAGIQGTFMNNTQQIIGRILREDVARGDTFDTLQFYPEGVVPNPAERLKPGYRAVTVNIEAPAAVGGFATPGAWVDVLFRAEEKEDADLPEMTVTLVESVEVLALEEQTFTGATADQNDRSNKQEMAVTLAVRPEQAAALQVVAGHGQLSLALRNPGDDTPLTLELPRTMHEVLDRPYTKWRMEVYRGGAISSVDFRRNQRRQPTPEEIAGRMAASKPGTVNPPVANPPAATPQNNSPQN